MPPPDETANGPARELWRLDARPTLPGPGWSELLDDLHAGLIELDPAYRLHQVKQKLGGLRFYADFDHAVRDRCLALVQAAERRALVTCERCGAPGEIRAERVWVMTLCDCCEALLARAEAIKRLSG
jgi:hypothetical protein